MATVTYSLASNFTTSHAINIPRFIKDVKNTTSITPLLDTINVNDDTVTLLFVSSLSNSEKTALDVVVANHVNGSSVISSIAYISDTKGVGTNGGSFTSGSWQTRDLNTVTGTNVDFWVTLSSNVFTLQPGTYHIQGNVPANNVSGHIARLYNNTTSSVAIKGSNASCKGVMSQSYSIISGSITISGSAQSFIIQHKCDNTTLINGLGSASGYGSNEIYTTINITKGT